MSTAERISLRRISPTFGFAEVPLPGVNPCGLRVEQGPDRLLVISLPAQVDRQGRTLPIYSLQPGTREAIEAAISDLWARSEGAG